MADLLCSNCGKPAAGVCARCRTVAFCSQSCQRENWKRGHKQSCGKIVSIGGEDELVTAAATAHYGVWKKLLGEYADEYMFYISKRFSYNSSVKNKMADFFAADVVDIEDKVLAHLQNPPPSYIDGLVVTTAVRLYARGFDKLIIECMHQKMIVGDIRFLVAGLYRAFSKFPLLPAMTVYRGTKNLSDAPLEDIVVSTSTDQEIAKGFADFECCVLRVDLPSQTRAIMIDQFFNETALSAALKRVSWFFEEEHEVLLPPMVWSDTEFFDDEYPATLSSTVKPLSLAPYEARFPLESDKEIYRHFAYHIIERAIDEATTAMKVPRNPEILLQNVNGFLRLGTPGNITRGEILSYYNPLLITIQKYFAEPKRYNLQRCLTFVSYLLEHGARPNIWCTTRYEFAREYADDKNPLISVLRFDSELLGGKPFTVKDRISDVTIEWLLGYVVAASEIGRVLSSSPLNKVYYLLDVFSERCRLFLDCQEGRRLGQLLLSNAMSVSSFDTTSLVYIKTKLLQKSCIVAAISISIYGVEHVIEWVDTLLEAGAANKIRIVDDYIITETLKVDPLNTVAKFLLTKYKPTPKDKQNVWYYDSVFRLFRDAITGSDAELVQAFLTNTTYAKDLANLLDVSSPQVLRVLLDNGADPNAAVDGSITPLVKAIMSKRIDLAITLLANNRVEFDTKDSLGMTPLMHAAQAGLPDVVRRLLELKVNPRRRDKTSHAALFYARQSGSEETIKLLQETR